MRARSTWLCCVALVLVACERTAPPPRAPFSLQEALGGPAEGFAIADRPREFRFPEDHGPHPEFRTEWWYVTGNLEGPEGEPYGFHFTAFRSALAPEPVARTSRAATEQVWMAHFAVTDGAAGRLVAAERFARDALGLGGAGADPFHVTVDGWRLDGVGGLGEERLPAFTLRAREGDLALALELTAEKPLVLQGDEGLSRKGAARGSASYYYAATRLATRGQVEIGGKRVEVNGTAWLDREWSTSLLEPHQIGWDWFALQLDDGTDLMVYHMRTDDAAGVDPSSHGAWVDAAGGKEHLALEHYDVVETGTWTSPHTGTTYPSGWRITARHPVTGARVELDATPLVLDQELRLAVRYWEGAIVLRGTHDGREVTGRGYAEFTGYDAPR